MFVPDGDGFAVGDSGDDCNVLTQTGCYVGDKCTWVHAATTPAPFGHIACAPDGAAETDAACTYGPDGATGYDDCDRGDVCRADRCAVICDNQGGQPSCGSGFGCAWLAGLIDSAGFSVAGVCNHSCDPFADNDALGSGVRAGSACLGSEGCYWTGTAPTSFTCESAGPSTLVHRSIAQPTSNGCAQGYVPFVSGNVGSSEVDCVALCTPGNTYAGNPGTQYPSGQSPHGCNTTDARGTFAGEQCTYLWRLEADAGSNFVASTIDGVVGFCLDHTRYRYDSNHNGFLDGSDATWPDCATLPLTGSPNAADFGCVDATLAGTIRSHVLDVPLPAYITGPR